MRLARTECRERVPRSAPISGSGDRQFLELAIAHQPVDSLLDQFTGRQIGALAQCILQRALEVVRGGTIVAMGTAERFV